MLTTKHRYEKYWLEKYSKTPVEHDKGSYPNEIIESVQTLLKNGNRFLDVGCGDGRLIDSAGTRYDDVYGCDISQVVLKHAKKRGMIATCLDLNTGYLPYQDGSFDTITSLEVIEHVLNPKQLLEEFHRLLRPKRQLILSTPNIRYFKNLGKLLLTGRFPHTTTDTFLWGGGHLHYFTRKDLTFLLQEAGFEEITFHMSEHQFRRSRKRRLVRGLTGDAVFGEWFCGGIIVEAIKE